MDLGRALAGSRPFTGGEVLLDGKPYRPHSVAAAVDAGIGFVTSNRQEEGCALELTVRENFLANPRADARAPWRWISPARERAEARSLVERFGVRPADSEAPIATLSGGNQQKIMIGRWLRLSRRVVILEEPTAERRRRRQGRDLPAPGRRPRRRARRPAHLHRLRGGRRRLPPRAGLRPGPRHRGTVRRLPHRHRTHPRRVGHRRR